MMLANTWTRGQVFGEEKTGYKAVVEMKVKGEHWTNVGLLGRIALQNPTYRKGSLGHIKQVKSKSVWESSEAALEELQQDYCGMQWGEVCEDI